MDGSASDHLQLRVQALYERVLNDSDRSGAPDARALELRLRAVRLADPQIPTEQYEHVPHSDVVVIN